MKIGSDVMVYGHIIMAIIWLLIIGLGIVLLASLFPKSSRSPVDAPQNSRSEPVGSAAQILKQRYTRAEISEEQYRRMSDELQQTDTYIKGSNDE